MTTTTSAGGVNAARDTAKDLHKATPLSVAEVPAPPAAPTSRSGGQDAAAAGEGEAPAAAAPAGGWTADQPLVVGLDLSLAATGVAHMRGQHLVTEVVTPPPNRREGLLRLRWMRTRLLDLIGAPVLVVVEGPSYSSFGRGTHDRAGLYWLVLDKLWAAGIPVAVAPPANLKQYATGKGGGKSASKDAVLVAAVRRLPGFDGGNDEADAAWLAAMGTGYLTGQHVVPVAHQAALAKVNWPTVARSA